MLIFDVWTDDRVFTIPKREQLIHVTFDVEIFHMVIQLAQF